MSVDEKKARRLNLANLISGGLPAFGIMTSTPEEEAGGVAPPRGVFTPSGVRRPGSIGGQSPVVYPSRPSKDAVKRGRKPKPKPNKFAR